MTDNPIQHVPKFVVIRYAGKDKRYSRFVIAERAVGYTAIEPIFTPIGEFRLEDTARRVCRMMNEDYCRAYVTGEEA